MYISNSGALVACSSWQVMRPNLNIFAIKITTNGVSLVWKTVLFPSFYFSVVEVEGKILSFPSGTALIDQTAHFDRSISLSVLNSIRHGHY